MTRELGLGEEGQGTLGHSGDTEFKCREKSWGGCDKIWDPNPQHKGHLSGSPLPSGYNPSFHGGWVVQASPPYTSRQPPAPPPSQSQALSTVYSLEAGFHPQGLSCN